MLCCVFRVGNFDSRIGMEGVLSMPAPHSPSLISLLSTRIHSSPPVCDWIQFASSEQELAALLLAVQGIPLAWLEWTEERVKTLEKRDHTVQFRVGYALKTLWNGITLLQEGKFLCDVLENSFRSSFAIFVSLNQITYSQLYPEKFLKKIRNIQSLIPADSSSVIQPSFILETGFEQLVRTMALNWKNISPVDPSNETSSAGFSSLFWSEVHCRDVNLFQHDMSKIRKIRNDVAHSRRLFSSEDILGLKELVCKWIKPLNIELMQKVGVYRNNRPNFLQDLGDI